MASAVVDIVWATVVSVYYSLVSVVIRLVPISWRRPKDVSKDVVLITGGGSGLGRLTAIEFACRLGSTVVIWDINADGNAETVRQVKEGGGRVHAYTCDVSQRRTIYETAKRVREEVGVVTILVNNAGIVIGKNLLDVPDEAIEKIFAINILAHFWTTKAFLPGMLDEGRGHIVTIASLAGHVGIAKLVDYCATKFAAVGFDEALHSELIVNGHDFIKTTCINPFFITSAMFHGVRSKVIPPLTAEIVVKEISRAVQLNQEVVILPWIFTLLLILKSIMCRKAMDIFSNAFGSFHMMDTFCGHEGKKVTPSAAEE